MIVKADKSHSEILAYMATKVWDDDNIEELTAEFDDFASSPQMVSFIKYVEDKPIGFANCSLRFDYVEGCETSPMSYLEGIYVDSDYQSLGIGKELLEACEDWSRSKGCVEFASDCELANNASEAFHKAVGFSEADRIICFKKSLCE